MPQKAAIVTAVGHVDGEFLRVEREVDCRVCIGRNKSVLKRFILI